MARLSKGFRVLEMREETAPRVDHRLRGSHAPDVAQSPAKARPASARAIVALTNGYGAANRWTLEARSLFIGVTPRAIAWSHPQP